MFTSCDNFTVIITVGNLAQNIATGLLFEHVASSIVDGGSVRSSLARPSPLMEPPLLVSPGGVVEKFEFEVLRRIEFVYLPNRRDLATYLASFQSKTDIADCFLIDLMETYCASTSDYYSLFAFFEQNFRWFLTNKSQHLCPMVVSVNVDNVSEAMDIGRNLQTFTNNSFTLVDDDASQRAAVLYDGDKKIFRCKISSDWKTINVSKL